MNERLHMENKQESRRAAVNGNGAAVFTAAFGIRQRYLQDKHENT